jgi:hypothetical protein
MLSRNISSVDKTKVRSSRKRPVVIVVAIHEISSVASPDDFVPKAGVFVKETMNVLADLGEKMGADPSTWSTSPP